jgi:hypothetical protein
MKIIKQSTYETCLASCLLMATGGPRKDEIEIWKHGWEFNYLIGQLNYVASKYGKKIEAYVENKYYFNQLQKKKDAGVQLINKKIDIKLIGELLKNGGVIVYLDIYYLQKILHAPHFVLALEKDKDFMKIADPSSGRIKKISIKTFQEGISGLRNHLKYSPVLITVS